MKSNWNGDLARLYWVLKKILHFLTEEISYYPEKRPSLSQVSCSYAVLLIYFLKPSLGFVQVVKGEGMPHFGSRSTKGDLFVEYNVILPLEVSSETRLSKSCRIGFSNTSGVHSS